MNWGRSNCFNEFKLHLFKTTLHILQSLDRNTDITYQVCAEGGGGAVSVRDFVYLRHWELVDGVYVCAMISTKHSNAPPHQKRVR